MCNASRPDTFYSRIFARVYDPVMRTMEQRVLLRNRRELLSGLTGDVLEVGSGTGINFPIYGPGCRVIASEPSAAMLHFARERLSEHPCQAEITLVQAGVGDAELESHIPADGLDAVVCTLVLCTIPDPKAALLRIREWLKPQGRLIVLEHIHGQSAPRRTIHGAVNPLWKHLAEGCHLTRDTDRLLREVGFVPLEEQYFTKGVPFYRAVMVRRQH